MKKYLFVILSLMSSSVMATMKTDNNDYYQDAYLAAGFSSHKLEDEKGSQFSALFGGRSYYQHSWFLGGELEASYIDNKDSSTKENSYFSAKLSAEEMYALGANIPVGKRFTFSDDFSIDAYGLLGYSMTRLKAKYRVYSYGFSDDDSELTTIHGPKWGLGIDTALSDYMAGIRWTRARLDGEDVNDALTEENFTLLVGYRF